MLNERQIIEDLKKVILPYEENAENYIDVLTIVSSLLAVSAFHIAAFASSIDNKDIQKTPVNKFYKSLRESVSFIYKQMCEKIKHSENKH